jgi:hypothetical protein
MINDANYKDDDAWHANLIPIDIYLKRSNALRDSYPTINILKKS